MTLKTPNNGIIQLTDLGTVTDGVVPQWLLVEDQGKPSVEINVYQQAEANSVALQDQVAAELADFMKNSTKIDPSG